MKSTLRSFGIAIVLATALPSFAAGCSSDDISSSVQDHHERAGRFEVFTGADSQRYFQLLAGNGEQLLRSEGYVGLSGAKNGVESVKTNAAERDNFRVLRAENGEHYFNLVAGNHQIIATSETYSSEAAAEHGVEAVMHAAESAPIAELLAGGPKFESFEGADGQTYFHLRANNGEIVLQSEGYVSDSGAANGIESVKSNGADLDNYETLEAQNGQYYFTVSAGNGQTIGHGELYTSKYSASRGAETVRRIIRELTDVAPSDDDIRREIESAAEGLTYMSEADYPWTWVHAELVGGEQDPDFHITEELIRERMAVYIDNDSEADGPLADLYADSAGWDPSKAGECFDEDDDWSRDMCLKQAALDSVLTQNLTDVMVFHFGRYGSPGYVDGVAVSIIIVGRTPSGNLAGVRTIAIWT
jgi:uncharacterized protein YegP (UPF0339 family)